MNFKAYKFVSTLALILSFSAPALAQNYSERPKTGEFVTHDGKRLVLQAVKLRGTLFGKQIWAQIDESTASWSRDKKCSNSKCWVYLGRFKPN